MAATSKPSRLETGDELDDFVDAHDVALVEFYTSGCAMCQAMEPVLGNVARATDVAIGMVNPGDDIELVDRFDIRSVPTLVLFEDGTETARLAEGSRAATPSPSSWPSTFRTPSVPTDRIRFVTAAHCSSPRTLIIARSYSPSMSDEDGADLLALCCDAVADLDDTALRDALEYFDPDLVYVVRESSDVRVVSRLRRAFRRAGRLRRRPRRRSDGDGRRYHVRRSRGRRRCSRTVPKTTRRRPRSTSSVTISSRRPTPSCWSRPSPVANRSPATSRASERDGDRADRCARGGLRSRLGADRRRRAGHDTGSGSRPVAPLRCGRTRLSHLRPARFGGRLVGPGRPVRAASACQRRADDRTAPPERMGTRRARPSPRPPRRTSARSRGSARRRLERSATARARSRSHVSCAAPTSWSRRRRPTRDAAVRRHRNGRATVDDHLVDRGLRSPTRRVRGLRRHRSVPRRAGRDDPQVRLVAGRRVRRAVARHVERPRI